MNAREFLLALSVPFSWALGFVVAKAGLEEFPPLLLMSIRFAIAALVLVAADDNHMPMMYCYIFWG